MLILSEIRAFEICIFLSFRPFLKLILVHIFSNSAPNIEIGIGKCSSHKYKTLTSNYIPEKKITNSQIHNNDIYNTNHLNTIIPRRSINKIENNVLYKNKK